MLNKEYVQKIPDWWRNDKYYDLVLSNDLDSLFSCEILKQVKGWQIQYFNHDFESMGVTDESNGEEPISVDLSITYGKTYDNHVVLLTENDDFNPESINFNVVDRVSRKNYFQKYCGSTLLMIWSLYDLPLPESEEAKMILLAIDSTYKGFYSPYTNDNNSNKKYLLEVMGFQELYETLERHVQNDFSKVIYKYNLSAKIDVHKGHLYTDIDLESIREIFHFPFLLPENRFYKLYDFNNVAQRLPKYNYDLVKNDISQDMFSVALTKRDFINYSENIVEM